MDDSPSFDHLEAPSPGWRLHNGSSGNLAALDHNVESAPSLCIEDDYTSCWNQVIFTILYLFKVCLCYSNSRVPEACQICPQMVLRSYVYKNIGTAAPPSGISGINMKLTA